MPTLKDLAEAGQNARAWCFTCARGETIDSAIYLRFEAKGWPIDLPSAAMRFRCKVCRSSAEVLLVPATRAPEREKSADDLPQSLPEKSWALQVEAFFHGNRAGRKRRR